MRLPCCRRETETGEAVGPPSRNGPRLGEKQTAAVMRRAHEMQGCGIELRSQNVRGDQAEAEGYINEFGRLSSTHRDARGRANRDALGGAALISDFDHPYWRSERRRRATRGVEDSASDEPRRPTYVWEVQRLQDLNLHFMKLVETLRRENCSLKSESEDV